MFKTILLSVAAFLPLAAESVRFDLRTSGGIEFDEAKVTAGTGVLKPYNWGPENERVGRRSCQFEVPVGQWASLGVSVTVPQECELSLMLMGPHRRREGNGEQIQVLPVSWDQVVVTGTTIENGGFELLNPTTKLPKLWSSKPAGPEGFPKVRTNDVKEGSNALTTWHNYPVSQKLRLTAKKPATITLWACPEPLQGDK